MKRLFSLVFVVLAVVSVKAIELPEIFGDNMMLQQQTQAKLWGWAKSGNTVEVAPSWEQNTYKVAVGKDGKWEIAVNTPAASYEEYSINIFEFDAAATGKKNKAMPVVDRKTIQNVLVGEVWFCSGQSNMEMPLGGFWNCPVEDANEAIAQSAKYKKSVRVATIAHDGAETPQLKVRGGWDVCEPKNASRFSACAYFFATTLADMLDIPVGVINCSWGGSCVEGWLPKEILEKYPDGLVPFNENSYMQKMVMYNGMLYPLAGYTIKGFLWNQGESNIGRENEYADRFATMVNLWRKMWNQPGDKLPIYTVELPPYWYDETDGDKGPKFRDVQHKIAKELANSGCVCTSDLIYEFEPKQIHGTKKKEIGQRLAYMALTRDYGFEGIAAEAPEFEYMEAHEASTADVQVIAGSKVAKNANEKGTVYHLYFKNAEDGFDRLADIDNFEAQGADGKWHPAIVWSDSAWQNVKRQGCFLKLVCPEAGEVKNVRYCYKNFVVGKLHGMRGLPVVPFTTEK